jgi:nucleoside 2-deoxyribosyltransferase
MKLCFVIMPIGSDDDYEIHLNRYESIIRAAVQGFRMNGEQAFNVVRADFISRTGSINKKVIEHIYKADAVIADLTDLNPNVFYELGVRHSLRNGTILVALEGTKIPFDVHDLNVVFYKDRVGGETKAIPRIQELLQALFESERVEDSPVFQVLPDLRENPGRDLREAQAKVARLETEASELRGKLSVAEAATLSLRDSFNSLERTLNTVLSKLAPEERKLATREVEKAAKDKPSVRVRTVEPPSGVEEDPNLAFVLMPFRETFVYNAIKHAATTLRFTILRADELVHPGLIMDQITGAIARAGVIIADITNSNPNVMLEVGIAMSLGKTIIMLAQIDEKIPFDIASSRVIFYENSNAGAKSLEKTLVETLLGVRTQQKRKKAWIRVDVTEVSGSRKALRRYTFDLDGDELQTLLNRLYSDYLSDHVPEFTYGKTWQLIQLPTKKVIKKIGQWDSRTLREAGIRAGTKLKLVML